MKKIFLLLIIVSHVVSLRAQNDQNAHLKFVPNTFKEAKQEGDIENLFSRMYKNWPTTVDGDDAALIRVKIENMSFKDAEQLEFKSSSNFKASKIEKDRLETNNEIWIFGTPTRDFKIWFIHPDYGTSTSYTINKKLDGKKVYEITLRNEKMATIIIQTQPQGVEVYFDGKYIGTTNLQKENVHYGQHTINLSYTNSNGTQNKEEIVIVGEGNIKFDYDLREKTFVSFTSEPSKAVVYMDDEILGQTPFNAEIINGKHIFRAEKYGVGTSDDIPIDVNSLNKKISIDIIKKKIVNIRAVRNKHNVIATVIVDGEKLGENKSIYTLNLPYGEHEVIFTGYDNGKMVRGTKRIKVSEKSSSSIEIELKAKGTRHMKWPLVDGHEQAVGGMSFAWVRKQWEVSGSGYKTKANIWASENQWVEGFQIGFHFQPCFEWGLGLYSGFFFEYYTTINEDVPSHEEYYDKWEEYSLYIPLQTTFMIPLYKKGAVYFRAGVGMDFGLLGELKVSENDYVDPVDDTYGNEGFPSRFNLTRELGVSLRFNAIMFHATWSKGLLNNKKIFVLDDGTYLDSKQNKFTLGFSIVF
ncbi:MAG: PEGA domain-containing protein [Bacteroidales bacterium]|nr:PEGA domain-containing protein [Bacteroidales bacterium]MDY6382189.1 PEGA domain-containing protein [Bacteroidales bacterium]